MNIVLSTFTGEYVPCVNLWSDMREVKLMVCQRILRNAGINICNSTFPISKSWIIQFQVICCIQSQHVCKIRRCIFGMIQFCSKRQWIIFEWSSNLLIYAFSKSNNCLANVLYVPKRDETPNWPNSNQNSVNVKLNPFHIHITIICCAYHICVDISVYHGIGTGIDRILGRRSAGRLTIARVHLSCAAVRMYTYTQTNTQVHKTHMEYLTRSPLQSTLAHRWNHSVTLKMHSTICFPMWFSVFYTITRL